MFKEIFPPIETALDMEPQELASFVLKHLKQIGKINRYNYTLSGNGGMREYAGERLKDFQKQLMEAFIWLEREMFIAPEPGSTGDWRFITRRGERILQEEDFTIYLKGVLLPSVNLHPILVKKVKPIFIRGDYDTAIFQAFKAVEVQVRRKGGYSKGDIGVSLMRKAFHPQTGLITNTQSEPAEKQAMSDLFSGAIGLFKNPTSHRYINGVSSEEATDIIKFANCLLRMLGD